MTSYRFYTNIYANNQPRYLYYVRKRIISFISGTAILLQIAGKNSIIISFDGDMIQTVL